MKKYTSIVAFFVLVFFELNLCFSQTVYSGTSYSGTTLQPVVYEGTVLEPFEYDGEVLYPISYTGSIINGTYYEGICLNDVKTTVITLKGNETSSDFFDETVPEEYRVNWKKVIGKFAVGTSIIVITGVVTLATGGTAGFIAGGMFAGALKGALIGAATDALITGSLSALKGKPKEQVFKESIEAAANGFMIGAITGAIAGGVRSVKDLKAGTPVLDSHGKIKYSINSKGQVFAARGASSKNAKALGTALGNCKNGNPSFFRGVDGKYYDFDGKVRNLKIDSGVIKENGKVFGLIDETDGKIATTKKEITAVIKKNWDSVKNTKYPEGSYDNVVKGKPGSGKILKNNYEAYYKTKAPKFAQAHHIVPKNVKSGPAKVARDVLEKYGIDINDPHNCALLPKDEVRAKTLNMMQHNGSTKGLHGDKIMQKMSEDLSRCTSQEEVFEVLADYRNAMINNSPFW